MLGTQMVRIRLTPQMARIRPTQGVLRWDGKAEGATRGMKSTEDGVNGEEATKVPSVELIWTPRETIGILQSRELHC